jgi:polyphosphate kinase
MTDFVIGENVRFQYVDREKSYSTFPATTKYEVKDYMGKVLDIRDLTEKQLQMQTVERNPLLDRSRFLVTVQFQNGQIKSFYDGRIVNVKKSKNFFRKVLDKLRLV